jgi:hypothetical protein
VPTLYVNGHNEKLILTGKEAIRRYLAACPSSEKPVPSGPGTPHLSKKAPSGAGISGSVLPQPPLGAPNPLFKPSDDEGLCKEDQKKCD